MDQATRYHPNHPHIEGRDVVLASEHEALHARVGELEQLLRDTTAVAITMLFDSHPTDTRAEFSRNELLAVITASQHLQDARVEHVYRRAWNAVTPTPAVKTQEAPSHG